jgi:hypothetical protein
VKIKRILAALAIAGSVGVGVAQPAAAGGSGDFHYQRYSAYVCGVRISVTNYDNSTGGQTYHFGFQSMDSNQTPRYWVIGSTTYWSYGYGGYINFSNKGTDHYFQGAINSGGGVCTMSIPASAWR